MRDCYGSYEAGSQSKGMFKLCAANARRGASREQGSRGAELTLMRTRFPLRSTSLMESLLESDMVAVTRYEARRRGIECRIELRSER